MSASPLVREVYDASYRRLVVQLTAVSGDQAEAEDAVQEAFVKACRSGPGFDRLDSPEAWLRTVAMNHLRNRWRHLSVVHRVLPQLPGLTHEVELSPDHVALVRALQELDEPLREVVVLHHLADQRTRDIAEATGVPEGTVKARLVKARRRLSELLCEEEEHV